MIGRIAGLVGLLVACARCELMGAEAQVVFPSWEDHKGLAFTGSVFLNAPMAHGAIENGIFVKPGDGSIAPGQARQAFGYFVGYSLIPENSWLRPGIIAGIVYEQWMGVDWRVQPLLGVKAQISFLSVQFTGRGWGIGANFPI